MYTDIEPAKETPTTNPPLRDGLFKGIRRKFWLQAYVLCILVGAMLLGSYMITISKLPLFASQTSIHAVTDTGHDILNVFQVLPPVCHWCQTMNTSSDDTDHVARAAGSDNSARSTVLEHTFTNSYGKPYIGRYSPPSGKTFNHVTFKLTVTAAGRQFDRLGTLYFGDVEMWRTSTAEPTENGISWIQYKDMTHLLSILQKPQKVIFDIPNIVNEIYTAPLFVKLETFYDESPASAIPADDVFPLSARRAARDEPSTWRLPENNASSSLSFPQNTRKAIVTIAATGQISEEFFYTNVPDSLTDTFPQFGRLLGHSPFREVQLLIDGWLAGVAWPFPIVFTGGIVPGFWRPIVGIDAFDLREDEIDVSPWLGVLCDGQPHSFEIRVVGIDDSREDAPHLNAMVGDYWIVSGKIFVWRDEPGSITTGSHPELDASPPTMSLTSFVGEGTDGSNQTLYSTVEVNRMMSVTSVLSTNESAEYKELRWAQTLDHTSASLLHNAGATQETSYLTKYTNSAPHRAYSHIGEYPLILKSTFTQNEQGGFDITATLDRQQDISTGGNPVFPLPLDCSGDVDAVKRSHLWTRQNGSASYHAPGRCGGNSTGAGTTEQALVYSLDEMDATSQPGFRQDKRTYQRHVIARDGVLFKDEEQLHGFGEETIDLTSNYANASSPVGGNKDAVYVGRNPINTLGRGPAPL